MNSNTRLNQEKQLQIYKMESDHLRKKTIIINIILVVLLFPIVATLYVYDVGFLDITFYVLTFSFIFMVNLVFYHYTHLLPNVRLSMYITAIGLYIITNGVILDVGTPSIFTLLFLTYAIISLYQDVKITFFNSALLFFSGLVILFAYSEIFAVTYTLSPSIIYIFTFLVIFIALLLVSSFVLIKRKNHFYQQVAEAKENEYKYIDKVFQIQEEYREKSINYEKYYEKLESFSEALSNTIGMDNVFKERISVLKDLGRLKTKTVYKKYSDYTLPDLEELKQMELTTHKKMSYIAFKIAQSKEIIPDQKELLFEKKLPNLNDLEDDLDVKITAFSVFYILLRIGAFFIKPMSQEKIITVINSEEFNGIIDETILDIVNKNQDVLEDIILKHYKRGDVK